MEETQTNQRRDSEKEKRTGECIKWEWKSRTEQRKQALENSE